MNKLLILIAIISFFSCNNENVQKEYFENGNIKYEGQTNKKEQKIGIHKWYYPTGKIKIISYYENGLQSDTTKSFFSNGQLDYIGFFYKNKKHGISKSFFENGQLSAVENYSDGVLDGERKSYFENGEIKMFSISDMGESTYYEEFDSASGEIIDLFRKVQLNFPKEIKAGEVFEGDVQVYGSLYPSNIENIIVGFSDELRVGVAPSFEDIEISFGKNIINYNAGTITNNKPSVHYSLKKKSTTDEIGKSYYFWGFVNYERNNISKKFVFTHTFTVTK